MKLSTKCRYGVRAAVEIARYYGKGPAKRKNIALAQGISDSYLENILIILKGSGIIETSRGAKGGFQLTRPPSAITVLDLINGLEGPMQLVECIDDPVECERSVFCSARGLWQELSDAWNKILGNVTLQDLLDRETKVRAFTYTI